MVLESVAIRISQLAYEGFAWFSDYDTIILRETTQREIWGEYLGMNVYTVHAHLQI